MVSAIRPDGGHHFGVNYQLGVSDDLQSPTIQTRTMTLVRTRGMFSVCFGEQLAECSVVYVQVQ